MARPERNGQQASNPFAELDHPPTADVRQTRASATAQPFPQVILDAAWYVKWTLAALWVAVALCLIAGVAVSLYGGTRLAPTPGPVDRWSP